MYTMKVCDSLKGEWYAFFVCALQGAARYIFAGIQGSEFTFAAFIAGAVTNAVPGILLHIILVPLIVIALKKAGLVLNE